MENVSESIFDRIGGMNAVNAAVEIFYKKVMADDSINYFFEQTNIKMQIIKQKAFLAYAFGAPMKYTGQNMRNGHAHLAEKGLNDTHFNAVAGHLASTLQELNVPEDLMGEIMAIAESTRNDILGK